MNSHAELITAAVWLLAVHLLRPLNCHPSKKRWLATLASPSPFCSTSINSLIQFPWSTWNQICTQFWALPPLIFSAGQIMFAFQRIIWTQLLFVLVNDCKKRERERERQSMLKTHFPFSDSKWVWLHSTVCDCLKSSVCRYRLQCDIFSNCCSVWLWRLRIKRQQGGWFKYSQSGGFVYQRLCTVVRLSVFCCTILQIFTSSLTPIILCSQKKGFIFSCSHVAGF